jgi:hypothetical protein
MHRTPGLLLTNAKHLEPTRDTDRIRYPAEVDLGRKTACGWSGSTGSYRRESTMRMSTYAPKLLFTVKLALLTEVFQKTVKHFHSNTN